jgi:hypothetical protein
LNLHLKKLSHGVIENNSRTFVRPAFLLLDFVLFKSVFFRSFPEIELEPDRNQDDDGEDDEDDDGADEPPVDAVAKEDRLLLDGRIEVRSLARRFAIGARTAAGS